MGYRVAYQVRRALTRKNYRDATFTVPIVLVVLLTVHFFWYTVLMVLTA